MPLAARAATAFIALYMAAATAFVVAFALRQHDERTVTMNRAVFFGACMNVVVDMLVVVPLALALRYALLPWVVGAGMARALAEAEARVDDDCGSGAAGDSGAAAPIVVPDDAVEAALHLFSDGAALRSALAAADALDAADPRGSGDGAGGADDDGGFEMQQRRATSGKTDDATARRHASHGEKLRAFSGGGGKAPHRADSGGARRSSGGSVAKRGRSDGAVVLARGWESARGDSSGVPVWVHPASGSTTFERPTAGVVPPIPRGWLHVRTPTGQASALLSLSLSHTHTHIHTHTHTRVPFVSPFLSRLAQRASLYL